MLALAQMNHPFMPYTNPAMVRAVVYPITGGKAQMKIRAKLMSQPPGRARHFTATGARAANMDSE